MLLKKQEAGQITAQISAVVLLLLAFWVLCYRLDALPMHLWDESRQANNALEMLDSGNLLFTTYDGLPDFWNTKPHLLILMQWVCMKLLGPGLLALRLPSAIAGCLMIGAGFSFLNRRFGYTPAAAWIAVMLGCGGFNSYHVVRTGDYDALLTLFVFLASLSWLEYLENPGKVKALTKVSIWFTAAILTKGIAAAIWLPVWIAMGYAVKPRFYFKCSELALLSLIPILAAVGYYGLHEWFTPGYLKAVLENEFSGRYFKPNEGHITTWNYYLKVLWSDYFMGFIIMVAAATIIVKRPENRKIYVRILTGVLVFLLIISMSATRIYWYVAPAIPLLGILVILPLADIHNKFFNAGWTLLIISLMVFGYFKNYRNNTVSEGVSVAKVLLQAEKSGKLPFQAKWHVGHYHPIEKYYATVLSNKGLGLTINTAYDYVPQDTLIVSNMAHLDTLGKHFVMRQHRYPTDELPIWVMVVDSVLQR